jgi:Cu+-exporting ATPase
MTKVIPNVILSQFLWTFEIFYVRARPTKTYVKKVCYHCGDECRDELLTGDEKIFCCEGCKLVYDILRENNLCSYYNLNDKPGVSPKGARIGERFAWLDEDSVRQKIIRFTDGKLTRAAFFIPQIHCSSCIWLLESLHRINGGVLRSQVNFGRREADITFDETKVTLRGVVEMLSAIGYEPLIRPEDMESKPRKNRSTTYKIGIAGFCFGNIMLFSFPEYFSSGAFTEHGFRGLFSLLNFVLSLPVFFYCSSQFFRAAWLSLKQKFLNIDVPIALGILIMFIRSAWEILSASGAGYMDTMSGLVFFMLVGREFQNRTYDTLSFERDYKSFFPVSVMTKKNGRETSIPISELHAGDRIVVRNEELIPADSILVAGQASIDYSFVTGESVPHSKQPGSLLYAGGKLKGTAIEVETVKEVSQSYLTQLWNQSNYETRQTESRFQQLVNRISHYFTMVLVTVALASLAFWVHGGDTARGWNAFTAVLIIACPCALAISSPFTLGNILRLFGRKKFYLKNFAVIEKLAKVDTLVFDKTGTLTHSESAVVAFEGDALSSEQEKMVRAVVHHSSHPLSRMLYKALHGERVAVEKYREVPGKGISAEVFGIPVRIGSAAWNGLHVSVPPASTRVYVSLSGEVKGYYSLQNHYRDDLESVVRKLRKSGYKLSVLSGDHPGEKANLERIFGRDADLRFEQSPSDKLNYVLRLQQKKRNVLMVGDGLNDAGALKQSDAGITVSEHVNNFSPACDGILEASRFSSLPDFLRTAKASHGIILASFLIALLYNFIGLYYALSGNLSPVIAAILMPISAVTILSFTTGASNFYARKKLNDENHPAA